ncbi:MAG: glycogen/starch synthase [bacterium]
MRNKVQRILFAAAEVAPFAKAGGLADVAGALPRALSDLGLDVRIVLPLYRQIDRTRYAIRKRPERFTIRFDGLRHVVRVFASTLPKSSVPVYFIDHPHYEGAGDIYYQDVTNQKDQQELQVDRFLFFSRVIPEFLKALRWTPDVVHCHDWHTGAVPFFLARSREMSRARRPATVYTIHNLPLQGSVAVQRFEELCEGTTQDLRVPQAAIQRGYINLTKLGLLTADALTTVSPTYAREILTSAGGAGLAGTLRRRRSNLSGILNGLDIDAFNPATDSSIVNFTAQTLERRKKNTERLLRRGGLEPRRPVWGMVSRLTNQKGIDLVCEIIPRLVQWGGAIVLLGSGEPRLEQRLAALSRRYPKQLFLTIGFDVTLAQQIYAGCDGFLMPSVFEPCGLGQLIAMRYGAIPIVRATGGLRDTVTEGKTGFVFTRLTGTAFLAACSRFLRLFRNQTTWQALQRRAMGQDVSWSSPAKKYLRVYQKSVNRIP